MRWQNMYSANNIAPELKEAFLTKPIFNHILALFLLCCIAFNFFPCRIAPAEQNYGGDCTTTYGDYLGTNYIFVVEPKELHVLGDRSLGLHMYDSPDLKSEPIHTLESGTRVELLDSRPNSFMVSHAIGSTNGEVTYIKGWVDARFVIESSRIYVAMHPTAIYVSPNADAKIIMMIDTYDSLTVIDEHEDFYCVLLSTGVGYVVKE